MERNIVIAGASSTIAKSIIQKLAHQDVNLYCLSRTDDILNKNKIHFAQTDVLKDELPTAFLPEEIHGAVYMPGTINLKPFKRFRSSHLEADWAVNVGGATRFFQWVLPKMVNNSAALMFSSVAVQTGMPFHASVSMVKGAVEGLTRALAAEYAPRIRFNALALSLTNTKMAERFINSDDKLERSRARHPLNQIGDPDDIADLAAFLLSERSRFITGQVIPVDGGLSNLRV